MKVILIGAANPQTGRIIADIELMQYQRRPSSADQHFVGYIDANPAITAHHGLPVFGWDTLPQLVGEHVFVNTISQSTRVRRETTQRVLDAGGLLGNFVDPTAGVPEKMGAGAYLQEGVVIQAACEFGDNVTIHSGALLSHEAKIGAHCFIGPRVTMCGRVTVEEGAYIGAGATILPDLVIGAWSMVGAGTVVTQNVRPFDKVAGNPARNIGKMPPL